MSITDWLVIAGGLAAIAWVNWYFLLSGRSRAVEANASAGGVQEITITVQGGYDPAMVRVRSGARVRLIFDRQETSGCSDEIVLPDFGVRRFLPPLEKTTIEVTPRAPGSYEFTCGMGMLRGRLVVI